MFKFNNDILVWPADPLWQVKGVTSFKSVLVSGQLLTKLPGLTAAPDISGLVAQLCDWGAQARQATKIAEGLIAAGVIIDDTIEAPIDISSWPWGLPSAASLFGYALDTYASPEAEARVMRGKDVAARPSLEREPGENGTALSLPSSDLLSILRRRRSNRAFLDGAPIPFDTVSLLMRAALEVTRRYQLEDRGDLVASTAPSGGSLNTYDGYLLVQNVENLRRGVYVLSTRDLHLYSVSDVAPDFVRLFGGQAWMGSASAAVVLTARFDRQAWKYAFPTTIGSVMVEAGARAQNILLAASEAGLAACPLGMQGVGSYERGYATSLGICETSWRTTPVCAVILGLPDPVGDPLDFQTYEMLLGSDAT